jgi:hypothetical protein
MPGVPTPGEKVIIAVPVLPYDEREMCPPAKSPISRDVKVLKHLYREERLDFTSHWIANKGSDDYSIEKTTEAAINELVSSAKCEELLDLLHSMDNNRQP